MECVTMCPPFTKMLTSRGNRVASDKDIRLPLIKGNGYICAKSP